MRNFQSLFKTIFIFQIFCVFKIFAGSIPFNNDFNHYSGQEINDIRLVGERCTGTNYILGLIKKNFPDYHSSAPVKHFLPWFDLPAFNISKKVGEKQDFGLLSNLGDSILLVLAVRDPYDWLRSFYAQPHHASKDKMLRKDFLYFMQHEWIPADDKPEYVAPDHWNPYDQRRFSNVLELRKYKTLNYLQIGLLAKNFVIIKYEDVLKSPQDFISFLSRSYNLQKADDFQNVSTYKNEDKKTFRKSEYPPFKVKELVFVNRNMDWDTERLIGYDMQASVKRIEER